MNLRGCLSSDKFYRFLDGDSCLPRLHNDTIAKIVHVVKYKFAVIVTGAVGEFREIANQCPRLRGIVYNTGWYWMI